MTDTKLDEKTPETSMVDVDLEKQFARISSEKHKTQFIVGKTRAAMFFSVRATKGTTPSELSGKYTTLEKAIEAVETFVKNSKETFAVRSDRLHEERQKRKNAEPDSKNS